MSKTKSGISRAGLYRCCITLGQVLKFNIYGIAGFTYCCMHSRVLDSQIINKHHYNIKHIAYVIM